MTTTETEHRPLSGWCSPGPTGSRAKHRGCRWDLCGCDCHDKTRKDAT